MNKGKQIRRDADWRYAIKVGMDLGYPGNVIEALKSEPDPNKRVRILAEARRAWNKKFYK